MIQQELVCEKGHPLEENKLGMNWCALCDDIYSNPLANLPTETDIYVTGAGYGVWTDTGKKIHALRHSNSEFTICGEIRGEAVHKEVSGGSSEFCQSCHQVANRSSTTSVGGAESVDVDIDDFQE